MGQGVAGGRFNRAQLSEVGHLKADGLTVGTVLLVLS